MAAYAFATVLGDERDFFTQIPPAKVEQQNQLTLTLLCSPRSALLPSSLSQLLRGPTASPKGEGLESLPASRTLWAVLLPQRLPSHQ